MDAIRSNCRARFTAADMDFVISVFFQENTPQEPLIKLFSDPDSLDTILDDEKIFRAIIERTTCLNVSRPFYFYIMVRHVLRRGGIEDRAIADYVAAMLADFSYASRARNPLPESYPPMDYLFEMLAALQTANDRTRFLIRAHVGNHSLFISGVFPDRIHYQAQFRGAPEIEYYEHLGSANFRIASDYPMARQYDLTTVFSALSEKFHAVRLALNDMTDRLIFLGDREPSNNPILESTQDSPTNLMA